MIETDDDRMLFFDTDVFGEEIGIRPATTGAFAPFTVVGIYDAKPGERRDTYRRGAPLAGSGPQFECRASEMAKSMAGRAIATIRAIDYNIFKVEHDGTGMAFVEVKLA